VGGSVCGRGARLRARPRRGRGAGGRARVRAGRRPAERRSRRPPQLPKPPGAHRMYQGALGVHSPLTTSPGTPPLTPPSPPYTPSSPHVPGRLGRPLPALEVLRRRRRRRRLGLGPRGRPGLAPHPQQAEHLLRGGGGAGAQGARRVRGGRGPRTPGLALGAGVAAPTPRALPSVHSTAFSLPPLPPLSPPPPRDLAGVALDAGAAAGAGGGVRLGVADLGDRLAGARAVKRPSVVTWVGGEGRGGGDGDQGRARRGGGPP
jgi:hypothetical protein